MFLHEKDEEIRRLTEMKTKMTSSQELYKQEVTFLN